MLIRPISIKHADLFVTIHHRHNKAAGNGKFAIGCYMEVLITTGVWIREIGVAIGGRPRSRHLDNGITFEVYRVCTLKELGHLNVTSFLYSKIKKVAQAMGYIKVITYTLQSESGASLRAISATIEKMVEHKKQWNNSGGVVRSIQDVTVMPKYRWNLVYPPLIN